MDRTKAELVCGGETDRDTKFIAPSVYKSVSVEDSLMEAYVIRASHVRIETDQVQLAVWTYSPDRAGQGWPCKKALSRVIPNHCL